MHSIALRYLTIWLMLAFFLSSLNANVQLSFFNDIPNTPQETIVFESGSLFYTGALPHIDEFICTADNPSTETVVWFDAGGSEVSMGDGTGTELYWTGTSGEKTLHTTNSGGSNLIDVDNQGNNFTCGVSGTADEKSFGIYWVRSIFDSEAEIKNDVRGMRIYTKSTPPVIFEYTLQRGFFNLDPNAQYKVQSLKGLNIEFRPAPMEPSPAPAQSIIDNVRFLNTTTCQSIGTSGDDILYTTLFRGEYFNFGANLAANVPSLDTSECLASGATSQSVLSIRNISPDLYYTCPLVYNGIFVNIDNLNIDTGSNVVASLTSNTNDFNRRRMWVDFDINDRISLRYDREYVCIDKYGTSLSFRVIVTGDQTLEILESDTATIGITTPKNYNSSTIPNTLYCLTMDENAIVTWLSDTNANRSASTAPVSVTTNTSSLPHIDTPRNGRSDLVLNNVIALDREGYYICNGSSMQIRVGIFSQSPVAPIVATTPPESSQNISFISPRNITCSATNSAHPPPLFYWTGPRTSSTNLLNTTNFQVSDSGNYTCHGTNVEGADSATISILIVAPPPMLVAFNMSIPDFFFEQDSIQLFCTFSIATNLALTPVISWYQNSALLTDGTNGFQIEQMPTEDPWLYRSVLSVSAIPAISGQYYCSATVGNSAASTLSPFSIEVEASYMPDAVSVQLDRIGYLSAQISWAATNRTRLTPETYVISYCQLPACSSYVLSSGLTENSYTITGLMSATNYSVFVIITNRYGSTNGVSRNITTLLERALYFYDPSRSNSRTYFASGSIFRGGSGVGNEVTRFYCAPELTTDLITWYAPNGDIIPVGNTANSFYHTVNGANGESTLNLNSALTADNDGRNFTCRINSNGFVHDHYFGVYFILDVNTGQFIIGIRLFSKNDPPVVRAFTLQRGIFDFDFTQLYDIESLKLIFAPNFGWVFEPNLISPVSPDNSMQILTDVQFNSSSSICQLGYSSFFGDFFSISDRPFILKTPVNNYNTGPPLVGSSCIEDGSTAYVFAIGDGVTIAVVCPLLYDARFLDISSTDFIQFNYILNAGGTNPRRLLVDPAYTLAMIVHERTYVCQDKYGTSSSFRARVDASTPLEVFNSSTTVTATSNDTSYITNQTTLYCLSDSNLLAVEWYANTNPNISMGITYTLVSNNTMEQPYVSNPRVGRSDLIVSTALSSNRQGYFYCRDSMNRIMFYSIFSQLPVSPVAIVSPDVTSIEITIGSSTDVLICGFSNSPHPYTISYWIGTNSASIDTSLLLEADTGDYTCVSSNVVSSSTDSIFITVIPPAPHLVNSTQLLTQGDIFATDTFQLSCAFSTFQNVTSSISILWYHNGTLNIVFPNTTSFSALIATSTVTINSASVSESGQYECVATVGASLPANSTAISVVVHPIHLPDAISLSISSITFFTAFVSWSPTGRTPFLTESYILYYSRVGSGQLIYQTIPDGSTTFTLTGLVFNSEYTVYINATNRFGSTLGPTVSFSTEHVRLYFIKDGNIIPFSTGSIFRGGIHSDIFDVVSEYHCYPDSPDQVITWYQPNGTVIPPGTASSTGFYQTRDNATGESVFYANNAVSADNEGNNFTCSFNQTSGVMNVSYFGIYYARKDVSVFDVSGIRLYRTDNVIYEFVYQRGEFNLDFTQLYTVECLVASLQQANYWRFIPNLLSQTDITTTNTTLYQVQFDSSANCQNVGCEPLVQYAVFSNKAFLLQTSDTSVEFDINCILNDYEFSFNLGSPLAIAITCPLIFGARFLDIGTDITLIQNDLTANNPRRLWINSTATIATLEKERSYVCVDRYGEMVSFRVSINAAGTEPIQILASGSSTVPIVNGTNLVGSANIPNTLVCVTQSASNAANWYVDSNPNRSAAQSQAAVTTNSSLLPHVVSSRAGRSDLVLNSTIGNAQQGFYSCVTNPTIVLGIFSQTPVAPTAVISPNQTSIQVVIGTNTPTLNCNTSNVPFPSPIYLWTGSVTSPTAALDTGLLLEANTGVYTCTASNVVDLSSDTITINVVPPPPQFISIQQETNAPIYINDTFTLRCRFSTLSNVTSQINVLWYMNGTQVIAGSTINIGISYNGSLAIGSLTISSSQIVHTGDYQCNATVGGSQQTISTNLSFSFNLPPTPIAGSNLVNFLTPYVTQYFEITCEFTILSRFQSNLSILWYHNSTLPVATGSSVQITSDILNATTIRSTLNIMAIEFYRSGAYQCVGQVLDTLNSLNRTSSATSVQVLGPPSPNEDTVVGIKDVGLYVTFPLNLTCQFSILEIFINNLQIAWYHNDTRILMSTGVTFDSTIQGSNQLISTLHISAVTMDQAGTYYCNSTVVPYDVTSRSEDYMVIVNAAITPLIPANDITEGNVSANSITFTWTRSEYNDILTESYIVYYRVSDTEMYTMTSETMNTFITVSGLLPDTEYKYYVELINRFGTRASGIKSARTSMGSQPPPTGGISGLIGPIAGGIIVAVLFIIVSLVVILVVIFLIKRRGKKYKSTDTPVNQRHHRSINSTSSPRHLITDNVGVGLNFGIGLEDVKFIETTDEPRRPANTTFRKSMEIQETVMANQEAAEPLYEDFSFERYNVPIAIFPQRVLEYHLANNAEFDKQFSNLRKDFVHDVTSGSNMINKPKNRFANIIPYEHSRVKLSFTGENHSDYINACYIDGYYSPQSYIAAQGPMPHTVKEFWRMIWEKNIEHIVALTRVMEAMKKKCEQYWPENEHETCTIGNFDIKLKKIDRYTSYDIRILELQHSDYPKETRVVIQFHFTVWPDHGVPIFSSSLLTFINHTKEYHIPEKSQSPILVHCSAGVGRTGTFIVLDYFLEHMKENEKVNVYKIVAQLRENRCFMVQTKDQYMFIHDAIQDIISCQDTFIGDHDFQLYYENALIRDLNTMTTPFEDKYELITKTSRIVDPRDISESSDVANVMKNRYPNFVPFDSHRVSIIPDQDGEKDYINASFIHGYQKHKGFIAAQGPLESTVYDFWKMITKYRVQVVVMLTDLVEDGHEMCAKYWPEEGKEMLVHFLVVRCEKEEDFDEFVRRKLVVSTQQVSTHFLL